MKRLLEITDVICHAEGANQVSYHFRQAAVAKRLKFGLRDLKIPFRKFHLGWQTIVEFPKPHHKDLLFIGEPAIWVHADVNLREMKWFAARIRELRQSVPLPRVTVPEHPAPIPSLMAQMEGSESPLLPSAWPSPIASSARSSSPTHLQPVAGPSSISRHLGDVEIDTDDGSDPDSSSNIQELSLEAYHDAIAELEAQASSSGKTLGKRNLDQVIKEWLSPVEGARKRIRERA